MICSNCKKEFPDEFPFCTHCGERVAKKNPLTHSHNPAPKKRASVEDVTPKMHAVNSAAENTVKVGDNTAKRKIKALTVLVAALVAIIVFLIIHFTGSCQHVFLAATCSLPQTCEKCSETRGEALEHSVTAWETIKQATCAENGEEKGICALCGEIVTKQSEKTTNHVAGTWETQLPVNGDGKGKKALRCAVCGEIIETKEYETEAAAVTGVTEEGTTTESTSVQESEQQSTTLADEAIGESTSLDSTASTSSSDAQ